MVYGFKLILKMLLDLYTNFMSLELVQLVIKLPVKLLSAWPPKRGEYGGCRHCDAQVKWCFAVHKK